MSPRPSLYISCALLFESLYFLRALVADLVSFYVTVFSQLLSPSKRVGQTAKAWDSGRCRQRKSIKTRSLCYYQLQWDQELLPRRGGSSSGKTFRRDSEVALFAPSARAPFSSAPSQPNSLRRSPKACHVPRRRWPVWTRQLAPRRTATWRRRGRRSGGTGDRSRSWKECRCGRSFPP